MGLATTKQCLWCTEIDYIEHAFYQCTKLENFWRNVKQYILISYDWRLEINEKIALFGMSKSRNRGCRDKKESKPYHTDSQACHFKIQVWQM